jgi:hypothetical protein
LCLSISEPNPRWEGLSHSWVAGKIWSADCATALVYVGSNPVGEVKLLSVPKKVLSACFLKALFSGLPNLREGQDGVYCLRMREPKSGKGMKSLVNYTWLSRFQDAHEFHTHRQSRKLQLSSEMTEQMKREEARHLGVLKRDFESGALDENCVENGDETHFVINLDNGRILGAFDETEIRYTDVVSGGIGMTMLVRVAGGARAQLQPCFLCYSSPLATIKYAGWSTTHPACHAAFK